MAIELNHICKNFGVGNTPVLKDISFSIGDGEFVSLIGRSGSGKSTLLYVMSSLDTPTSGTVKIAGHDVNRLRQNDLHLFRNQHIGFVFQFHYLLPELTALENVLMPTLKSRRKEALLPYAQDLLEMFGLTKKTDRLPSQLSGGEQQRVAIARALIMNPRYLFADEPTGNLDSINGQTVMRILQKINIDKKTTIVLVTHDPEFAASAPRQIHLVDGKVTSDTHR